MSENLHTSRPVEMLTTTEAQRLFYTVSKAKFLTLFLMTLGTYQIYWAYKNWQQFRRFSGEDMWPVARAIFAIFWTHALYREADARIKQNGSNYRWQPGELATWYVMIAIILHVLDAMVQNKIGFPIIDLISLAFLPLHGWVIWLGQCGLNEAAGDPMGESNARFTPINYVFIVIGTLLWAMIVLAMLLSLP